MSLYRFISEETAAQFPRTRLQEGDFVISVRGTMGKVGIVPKELDGANITANLIRISPDRNKIYPCWLQQVFINERFQEQLNNASSSTTIKTIKALELSSLKLALPTLIEQKRIAEILLTIDSAIEKTSQLIEKKKELKKGLMQELLSRGIGHKKFRKTEVGEIPEGWEIAKIKDVGKIITGGTPPTKNMKYYNGEYLWATPADLGMNKYIRSTKRMLSKEGMEVSRIIPKDAILIVCIGSTIGKIGLAVQDMAANQQINSVICNNQLDSQFVYYWLLKSSNSLVSMAGRQAVPIVNKTDFSLLTIAKPPQIEQQRIGFILTSVDAEIEQEVSEKYKFEQLKKGLMQALLTGRVRVKI